MNFQKTLDNSKKGHPQTRIIMQWKQTNTASSTHTLPNETHTNKISFQLFLLPQNCGWHQISFSTYSLGTTSKNGNI